MFEILIIADCIIVGMIVFFLITALCKDSPLVRLIKLLAGIISGFAYFLFLGGMNIGEIFPNISLGEFLFFLLTPVIIVLILAVLGYMFKDK